MGLEPVPVCRIRQPLSTICQRSGRNGVARYGVGESLCRIRSSRHCGIEDELIVVVREVQREGRGPSGEIDGRDVVRALGRCKARYGEAYRRDQGAPRHGIRFLIVVQGSRKVATSTRLCQASLMANNGYLEEPVGGQAPLNTQGNIGFLGAKVKPLAGARAGARLSRKARKTLM